MVDNQHYKIDLDYSNDVDNNKIANDANEKTTTYKVSYY